MLAEAAAEFASVKDAFTKQDALGYDLWAWCPMGLKISLTSLNLPSQPSSQPASHFIVRSMSGTPYRPARVHSLGEYSALVLPAHCR